MSVRGYALHSVYPTFLISMTTNCLEIQSMVNLAMALWYHDDQQEAGLWLVGVRPPQADAQQKIGGISVFSVETEFK